MRVDVLGWLAPPLATFRRGAAVGCTGPIAVFWLTALVSVVFGFVGGPLGRDGISWLTVGLGVFMWIVAVVWAELVIAASDAERLGHVHHDPIEFQEDEKDPFDNVRR